MSKIGKKPIFIPEEVKVRLEEGFLVFSGKNGELKVKFLADVEVKIENNNIIFSIKKHTRQAKSNWGTICALSNNALKGSMEDFVKVLKIEGVGCRANIEGEKLILNVGYSHPVEFLIPMGIKISVEKNIVKITGPDKFLVGETAARIRRIRKPEPYKGTGIMYVDEIIRRKAGKKLAAATNK